MRVIKWAIFWTFDIACGATGHDLFLCYYRAGLGPIRRLWHWSMS